MGRRLFGLMLSLGIAACASVAIADGLRFLDPCVCPGDNTCPGDCGFCSPGDYEPCSVGYCTVEALFLTRDNRNTGPAVIRVTDEGNAAPGRTVLTADGAHFDFKPGVSVLFGWRPDDWHAWELSYFNVYSLRASAVVTGNNNLAIPGDLGLNSSSFFAADRMELDHRSTINNAEFNTARLLYDDFSFLAGFRFVSLNEEFNIRSTDADAGTSNYNVRTANNLFGGQVGARWKRMRGNWDVIITAKVGVFGNDAQQRQLVTDFPPPSIVRNTDPTRGGNVAFVGDVNFSTVFHLSDLWALRAGYNLLWIEGVALANQQLNFSNTPASGLALNHSGGFFAHGLNFGFQATW